MSLILLVDIKNELKYMTFNVKEAFPIKRKVFIKMIKKG